MLLELKRQHNTMAMAENILDAGKKWVKGIDSSVPGFWHNCPEIVGANSKGYDIVCATPHFVFIYQDGEKLTCRKCNKESTIKIVLPEE